MANKFIDVPEDHWAAKPINELSDMGLINGYEDGTFKPDEPITRAEVAAIQSRFLHYLSVKNSALRR